MHPPDKYLSICHNLSKYANRAYPPLHTNSLRFFSSLFLVSFLKLRINANNPPHNAFIEATVNVFILSFHTARAMNDVYVSFFHSVYNLWRNLWLDFFFLHFAFEAQLNLMRMWVTLCGDPWWSAAGTLRHNIRASHRHCHRHRNTSVFNFPLTQ